MRKMKSRRVTVEASFIFSWIISNDGNLPMVKPRKIKTINVYILNIIVSSQQGKNSSVNFASSLYVLFFDEETNGRLCF